MDAAFVETLKRSFAGPSVLQSYDGKDRIILPTGFGVYEEPQHRPKPIQLWTLTGLHDYLEANPDKLDREAFMVHVTGERAVEVVGVLEGEDEKFRRKVFVECGVPALDFRFGTFMPADVFLVGLMTMFEPSVAREALTVAISSIEASSGVRLADDGVTQEISTRQGIAMVGRSGLPNPVRLIPYRTFREIEQPESEFVLRARGGGESPIQLALFEADGGKWKLDAVTRIAKWLRGSKVFVERSLTVVA